MAAVLECRNSVSGLSENVTNDSCSIADAAALARFDGQLPETAKYLDLSKLQLSSVPKVTFSCSKLKGLYLEGNSLTSIPEALFIDLPNLTLLDLRSNKITALPTSIGKHQKLQTLLLEDNSVATLPVELGDVSTLTAISLSKNPMYFPAKQIVDQGVRAILEFLRSRNPETVKRPQTPEQLPEKVIDMRPNVRPKRVSKALIESSHVPRLQHFTRTETTFMSAPMVRSVPVRRQERVHPSPSVPVLPKKAARAKQPPRTRPKTTQLTSTRKFAEPLRALELPQIDDTCSDTKDKDVGTDAPKISMTRSASAHVRSTEDHGLAKNFKQLELTKEIKAAVRASTARQRARLEQYRMKRPATSIHRRNLDV